MEQPLREGGGGKSEIKVPVFLFKTVARRVSGTSLQRRTHKH